MSLDIWSRNDIRNVILAANAAGADVSNRAMDLSQEAPEARQHLNDYRAGYEAALITLATAFGIPLVSNGRLRSPGVAIPGGRLAISYRAQQTLSRLLQEREEIES